MEPTTTSIICIHNQTNPTSNLQTPNELYNVLKTTINFQIETYPIQPTFKNYHVKTSKAWKEAPKTTMSTPTNIHQIPIPNKYEHIHPLKYHPQQCIYTNRSFIPPTKNIEGLIEGNATGSGVYSPTTTPE